MRWGLSQHFVDLVMKLSQLDGIRYNKSRQCKLLPQAWDLKQNRFGHVCLCLLVLDQQLRSWNLLVHMLHVAVHQQLKWAESVIDFLKPCFVLFDTYFHDFECFCVLFQQSWSLRCNFLTHLLATCELLCGIDHPVKFVSSYPEALNQFLNSERVQIDSFFELSSLTVNS